MLYGFPLLCDRHQRCGDRDDGQYHERCDGPGPQTPEPPLLAQIIAGQLVFGYVMDGGRERGDFVAERK